MNIITVFEELNGASFVSIDTVTAVKLTGGQKNDQQGRVKKHTTNLHVMVFQNKKSNGYLNMIQRRLIQEGKDPESFVMGPRRWGHRIPNTPFISHVKDGLRCFYLEVICLNSGETFYTIDDNPIEVADIVGLPVRTEGEQAGLNNKVIIRSFGIEGIVTVRANRQVYTDLEFIPNDEQEAFIEEHCPE